MDQYFVFDLNPTIVHLGPLQLRYYGIIFATMLYVGFLIWRHQMLRGGYSVQVTEKFLVWGVVAVLVGSRLGHCLFYEPARYLSNPISILYVWKGGLSSHGATIGLVVALITFARRYKLPVIEVLDRFSMSSAVGAAAVRLGNFFNSEIVGRETNVPWAVRFPRYDCGGHRDVVQLCSAAVPRHPSQLYEFTFGLFVLGSLYAADRLAKGERRPRGLLAGLFLALYFVGRFMIEFVKEYQVDELIANRSFLTMGQYLSIVPFLAGCGLLVWSIVRYRKHVPEDHAAALQNDAPKPNQKIKKKSKGKKR